MTKTLTHGIQHNRKVARRGDGNDFGQVLLLERAIKMHCDNKSPLSLPLLQHDVDSSQKPFRLRPLSNRKENRRSSTNHPEPAFSLSTRRRRKPPRRNAFVIRCHGMLPISLFTVPATSEIHFEYTGASGMHSKASCGMDRTSGTSSNDDSTESIAQQILDDSLRTLKNGLGDLSL